MCGIFGFTRNYSDEEVENKLDKMSKSLIHRGPDATGFYHDDFIAMGMNRLSIIDLDERSNQPMHSYDERYSIVFNGEIYNYLDLYDELKDKYNFKTASDTEVLLYIFIEFGIEGLNKLNGMFTFCIYDKQKKEFYLGRDRIGVKPLYYYLDSELLIFSSEMKGILAHTQFNKDDINKQSLAYYVIYETVPEDNTIFNNVTVVEPGTVLTINNKLSIKKDTYWSLPDLKPDYELKEEYVIDKVQEIIEDAVKIRLHSDVPVGIFLSGGIDSTLIAAIAKKYHPNIMSFSIGYEDKKHDESVFAEETARYLELDQHTLIIDPFSVDKNILDLISDSMVGNPTFLPYLLLSEYASQHITVALNGDGGDEFFCGYSIVNTLSKIIKLKKFVPNLLWKGALKLVGPIYKKFNLPKSWVIDILDFDTSEELLALLQAKVTKKELNQILKEYSLPSSYKPDDNHTSFQDLNYQMAHTFLPNTVLKTSDMANMAFSVEGRSPLLDYRLIEFSAKIPESLHTKDGESKYILKKVLERYMPRELFDRPKKGFSVPTTDLKQFRNDLFNRFKKKYISEKN